MPVASVPDSTLPMELWCGYKQNILNDLEKARLVSFCTTKTNSRARDNNVNCNHSNVCLHIQI